MVNSSDPEQSLDIKADLHTMCLNPPLWADASEVTAFILLNKEKAVTQSIHKQQYAG